MLLEWDIPPGSADYRYTVSLLHELERLRDFWEILTFYTLGLHGRLGGFAVLYLGRLPNICSFATFCYCFLFLLFSREFGTSPDVLATPNTYIDTYNIDHLVASRRDEFPLRNGVDQYTSSFRYA